MVLMPFSTPALASRAEVRGTPREWNARDQDAVPRARLSPAVVCIQAVGKVAEFMKSVDLYEERQRRKAEYSAKVAERKRMLDEAGRPIVDELRALGYHVNSVYDLGSRGESYESALPVLMKHLERGGYPDIIMQGLGHALAAKPALVYWDRLKALYINSDSRLMLRGLADALSEIATKAQVEDLIELLDVENRPDGTLFILPILQKGGERGRDVVEAIQDHPLYGKEATYRISRRKKRPPKK